ncbi:UDP-glucose--hexose-1-phosphate uridylyltransferase [Leuconostoc holzapfelii]|uniref:Galactose-1-phosphate uridylyltransferase n=1 Tax=Leuconostoc holzapfelii TaxID=434464 RepID=A0A846ZGI2_9LACO|nr:UDP-glucose--hexose-1-phosphate uridylyltransferase [Leuconostoc holzapfelii]NKZ18142.1 UDP-glucose--hexose-1-phosphate uridylyltransferase [Leuconostoc holzapfelii]
MNQNGLIETFVQRVIAATDYTAMDETYLINQVIGWLGETRYEIPNDLAPWESVDTLTLLDALITIADENQSLVRREMNADMLGAQLMALFVPRPSKVNQIFWDKYAVTARQATDYFFDLSCRSNYIKTREIKQNMSFPATTKYGTLQVTINLSKPEKDPKKIAAALKTQTSSHNNYPVSQLAHENEGYWGRLDYPARANHRVVALTLGGEPWFFQYSPYAYFNEHAIIFSKTIRPMRVDAAHLAKLLEFVTLFPDYFIGSNADLPIVGGSILTHDHFQAGRYDLPMAQATIKTPIALPGSPLAEAGVLNWPMTVIRLADADQARLLQAATQVMTTWENYSDPSLAIRAYDESGVRHHTVTPIARFRDGRYELDLVLRDNNVSADFPDGIFHPHPDVQHIKQENIGLIEVMGLAILPPRLKNELHEVADYLLGRVDHVAPKHQTWADRLRAQATVTPDNVMAIIQHSVGQIFERVLEDAGVYKDDAAGEAGLARFLEAVAQTPDQKN